MRHVYGWKKYQPDTVALVWNRLAPNITNIIAFDLDPNGPGFLDDMSTLTLFAAHFVTILKKEGSDRVPLSAG